MKSELSCDVAIIGAGTAGLSVERSARHAGASTLLIDAAFVGTTCANVGCMPSKLLIAAGNAAHGVRQAAKFGVQASPAIDGPAVMTRLRNERDAFAKATRDEIAKLPKDVAVRGIARFLDDATLALDDGRRIKARTFVIATGSRPSIPEPFRPLSARVLTNETLFELPDLPRSMAVVGSGPLGLELAQALARLGVAITLFDQADRLAAVEDAKVNGLLQMAMEREFPLFLGVKLHPSLRDGQVSLGWDGASDGERQFDYVLLAAGRPPDLGALNLSATRLKLDERGVPHFNPETMQCGDSSIFLAGDAAADRPVLHEASAEGALAGCNAASFPKVTAQQRGASFSVMFTDPPLGLIGQHSGDGLICGDSDYSRQGRAKVEGRAEGLVRIYAGASVGTLKGAVLFCPGADHLAHLLVWAIDAGVEASTLLERPFYHPTFEEGLKSALRQICESVGIAPPPLRDWGAPPGA